MATESFIAKLGFEMGAFNRGLSNAKKEAKRFASDMQKTMSSGVVGSIAGAATIGSVAAAVRHVVDYADSVSDLSANLGVGTDFLQAFTHGIATSGGSAESAQASLQKFSDVVGSAASGSLDAQLSLGRFGLTVVDANGRLKTTEQLLLEASDLLRGIESPAERAAVAMDLFGKSGPKALAFLSQGSESMKQFVASADKLSVESVERLAAAKDKIEGVFHAITIAAGEAISVVSKLAEKLTLYAFGPVGAAIGAIVKLSKAGLNAGVGGGAKPTYEPAKSTVAAGSRVFEELQNKIGKEREAQRKKELEAERKLGEEIKKNLERIIEFGERKKAAQLGLEESTRNLAMSRSDRSRFTLEELATSQIRYSGRLGAEQQQAQRAFQLEQFAEINRLRGFGDLSVSQLNTADEIRKGLTNLRDSERFPFKDLTERVEASNAELQKLNNLAQTEGVLIRPTNGE